MEYVLQHLGPSAKPLMSFLYKNEATNLLQVTKYIGSLVSAYQERWGFTSQIFKKEPSYGFRISKNSGYTLHSPLEKDEYFFIEMYNNKSSRLWTYKGERWWRTLSHFFDPDETVQIASEIRAQGYHLVIKN